MITGEDEKKKLYNTVIPKVDGGSEKLKRIFNKHCFLVFFKPRNTLRQKPVHPKDYTSKHLSRAI